MAQTKLIVDTLKNEPRKQDVTLRQDSEVLPLGERFGCTLIMAIRPWEVKIFDDLRREPNEKKF